MPGHLQITFGPMFSEKTSSLIQNIRNKHIVSTLKGKKFSGVVVNHSSDKRKETKKIANLTTHNGLISPLAFPKEIEFLSCSKLKEIVEKLDDYDYISIDECQFFEDLVEVVLNLLEREKDIHLVGLIADADRKPFGHLMELFNEADEIEQKKAYCVFCKSSERAAAFTKYIGKEKKLESKKVGAKNEYVPTCRYHHQ